MRETRRWTQVGPELLCNHAAEFGYETYKEGPKRLGWLLNLVNTTVSRDGSPDRSGLECFFIEQNGNLFKATVIYR